MNRECVKRVVVSVDWGFTNPGVLQSWAVDGDGRMYLINEVYHTRKTIDWWIEKAKAVRTRFAPEVFVCDPSEPSYIQQFLNAGLPTVPAFNDISIGIQAVQMRLKVAGDGKPRLFLMIGAGEESADEALAASRMPSGVIEEIEGYMWPKGVDGKSVKEVPLDVNNHAMDAMRYAVAYVDGLDGTPFSFRILDTAPAPAGPDRPRTPDPDAGWTRAWSRQE